MALIIIPTYIMNYYLKKVNLPNMVPFTTVLLKLECHFFDEKLIISTVLTGKIIRL